MNFKKVQQWFPFSWKNAAVTTAILSCAGGLCVLLRQVDSSDSFVPLVFVLAVLLTSRLTTGYLFGILAAIISVIGVNYVFTYPYLEFNFSIAGYPLTFFTMLVVSIMTSALTTQIKRQERLRLESETEKMRADLLRSVSHDIRTPLTSIMGSTSAVLDNGDSLSKEEQQALLRDARDEAQWLIRVVENLLSITRIGNQEARIVKTPEAAEEVLGEAVCKFHKRHPEIEFSVQAPEELLMVPMDAILIEQVLANLMENAALHGKTVTELQIWAKRVMDRARFTVSDNGVGISPGLLPTLLDGTPKSGGTTAVDGRRNMGLGLTVCTAIVRAHGGQMFAANRPGGGAELSFDLPLQEEVHG